MATSPRRNVRCRACGAVYWTHQADGTEYYHACAPLSEPELAGAVDAGTFVLPEGEDVATAVRRRPYDRPNRRDENVVQDRRTGTVTMKAEGAGVEPV